MNCKWQILEKVFLIFRGKVIFEQYYMKIYGMFSVGFYIQEVFNFFGCQFWLLIQENNYFGYVELQEIKIKYLLMLNYV